MNNKISNLFEMRPAIYAVSYLTLIPFFAIIFFFNANGFYQSTVAQEGTLKLHKQDIDTILTSYFKEQLNISEDVFNMKCSSSPNCKIVAMKVRLYISDITIQDFEEEEFQLDLVLKIKNEIAFIQKGQKIELQKVLPKILVSIRTVNYGRYGYQEAFPRSLHLRLKKVTSSAEQPLISEIFPKIIAESFPVLSLTSPKLEKAIKAYRDASLGKPTNSRSTFIKMLYFSTVTITTLGFGDIVPLTNATRLLVSIESILGIILIGLFLNSLTIKRAQILK